MVSSDNTVRGPGTPSLSLNSITKLISISVYSLTSSEVILEPSQRTFDEKVHSNVSYCVENQESSQTKLEHEESNNFIERIHLLKKISCHKVCVHAFFFTPPSILENFLQFNLRN